MRNTIVAALLLVILVSPCSSAQAYEPMGADGEWDFVVTPYIWLPARSDITSTIGALPPVEMELTFKDVIENFDVFALSMRFEAWKGKLGLIFDGYYMKLNTSRSVVLSSPGPIPITLSLDVDKVDVQQAIFDFAAAYRVLEKPLRKGSDFPVLYFDPFLGVRVNYLKQEVTGRAELSGREILNGTIGDEKTWPELMFGGRFTLQVLEKLSFAVRGSVSGFGIGEGSDLQWDFLGGADYRPWRVASFKAGYRIYQIDYMTGSDFDTFGYDATQHGPLLGVSFYF